MTKNELLEKVNELRELQKNADDIIQLFLLAQFDYESCYYLDKRGDDNDVIMPSNGNNFFDDDNDVIMQLLSALDIAKTETKEAKKNNRHQGQALRFTFTFNYLENYHCHQSSFELYSDEVESVEQFLDEILTEEIENN